MPVCLSGEQGMHMCVRKPCAECEQSLGGMRDVEKRDEGKESLFKVVRQSLLQRHPLTVISYTCAMPIGGSMYVIWTLDRQFGFALPSSIMFHPMYNGDTNMCTFGFRHSPKEKPATRSNSKRMCVDWEKLERWSYS